MKIIIRLLEKYGYLSTACKNAILQNSRTLYKNKSDLLLEQGSLPTDLYVVEKGGVRAFYTSFNQSSIDLWYNFENSIIGSTLQMYKSKVALQNLQCMEDCVLHTISNTALLGLYKDYPELNIIARRFMEDYCHEVEYRSFVFQTQNPIGRYRELIKSIGRNVTRIPKNNLASYLGVNLSDLERIQKL